MANCDTVIASAVSGERKTTDSVLTDDVCQKKRVQLSAAEQTVTDQLPDNGQRSAYHQLKHI